MNIGIFAPMTGREAGGPETYDMELVRGLARMNGNDQYTVYCVNASAKQRFQVQNARFRTHLLRPANRFINIPVSLPLELIRHPVDVLHATFVAPPVCPAKVIFTLLDLSPFSHPHFYPPAIRLRLQKLFASSINKASAIVSISEFSRNDLFERFNYPRDRAFVTHLGVDPRYKKIEDTALLQTKLDQYKITTPYILCVGKLQARKNTVGLLRAFHLLKQQERVPHKLLFVGRKTWTSSDVEPLIKELGIEDEIMHTGHVPDEDLPYFYNAAEVLAYPSLFEGFGLPIVEAMACGTPVVTSNVTSLPEVAGDAGELVDPHSIEDIARGLHRVISDSALRGRMIAKGLERVKLFTWEETARKTTAVYQQFSPLAKTS